MRVARSRRAMCLAVPERQKRRNSRYLRRAGLYRYLVGLRKLRTRGLHGFGSHARELDMSCRSSAAGGPFATGECSFSALVERTVERTKSRHVERPEELETGERAPAASLA